MGRRIEEVAAAEFNEVEELAKAYASPYLKHAWLGILSWNPEQAGQHNIWFLKLPLDEQNMLLPGPRDAFLQYWVQAATEQQPDRTRQGDAPCVFKPDAHRMAYFHVLALKALEQPCTQYYSTARAYLSGDLGWDNWQQLGLQGLAEVVARSDEDQNQALLAQSLSYMPSTPRNIVLGYLENTRPSQTLALAMNDCLSQVVAAGASAVDLAAFARGLSRIENHQQRQLLLQVLLAHPASTSVEVLAAMGSRCWQDLTGELLFSYLECLAINDQGLDAFNTLLAELMALPGMREHILHIFRRPDRSESLSSAIDQLMASVREQEDLSTH